jgi:hypothetical protein
MAERSLAILAFWHESDPGEVTKALADSEATKQYKISPGAAVSLVIPPDDRDFAAICHKLDLNELHQGRPAADQKEGIGE